MEQLGKKTCDTLVVAATAAGINLTAGVTSHGGTNICDTLGYSLHYLPPATDHHCPLASTKVYWLWQRQWKQNHAKLWILLVFNLQLCINQSQPASQPTNQPPTQWAKIEHASISILINVDLNSRRYKEYLRRCSTRSSTDVVWTSCTVNTDNTATYCHTTWTSQHNRIWHRVINVHPR